MYLCLVLQHLGSSNASGLLHDAKSLNPIRSNWCACGTVGATSAQAPKVCLQKRLVIPPRQLGTGGSRDYHGTDHSEQTGPDSGVPVASAPKSPQGAMQNRKKQKYSENITFYKIVNMAWQMWHQSLARELSGTIRVILETVQTLGCKGKQFKIYYGKHRS